MNYNRFPILAMCTCIGVMETAGALLQSVKSQGCFQIRTDLEAYQIFTEGPKYKENIHLKYRSVGLK